MQLPPSMNDHAEAFRSSHDFPSETAEVESTLVSVLLAAMMAVLLLVIGATDRGHRVVQPDGDVVETEVVRRGLPGPPS